MRVGSLFSGIGGLELALGLPVAWHCEIDPHASTVLAHHWPGVHNLGDITKVKWNRVEPVDILIGGFPCQDLSHAGRGLGIEKGTRSGLWYAFDEAIRRLRPRVVLVENVGALRTRRRGRDFNTVLSDLAEARYDARWTSLRAASIGAPHRRERVFVLAVDADAGRMGLGWGRPGDLGGQADQAVATDALGGGLQRQRGPLVLAGAAGEAQGQGGQWERSGDTLGGGSEALAYTHRGRLQDGLQPVVAPPAQQQAPRRSDVVRRRGPLAHTNGTALDPVGDAQRQDSPASDVRGGPAQLGGRHRLAADPDDIGSQRGFSKPLRDGGRSYPGPDLWGPYLDAVQGWEAILGRRAPHPLDGGRLSVWFVEWMMGFPEGWVSDLANLQGRPAKGEIGRTSALKALGNAVVPQQARAAWIMLSRGML